MKFPDILQLFRVNHWWKNLIIFLFPVLLSDFTTEFRGLIVALISLFFASSALYIFNDITNKNQDQFSNKKRPIAAGQIEAKVALVMLVISTFIALILSLNVSLTIFGVTVLFILTGFSYSLIFRQIFILDILNICVLYMLRATMGLLIINYLTYLPVYIGLFGYLWIFTSVFYIVLGKRRYEAKVLRLKTDYRNTLKIYRLLKKKFLFWFMLTSVFSFGMLLLSFQNLIYLLLFSPYLILIYKQYDLTVNKNKAAFIPKTLFKDKIFLLFFAIEVSILFYITYF